MRAGLGIGLFGLLLVCATPGCAAKRPCTYERKVQIHELAADVGPVENAYHLMAREQTEGRFACSLAVAKLVATDDAGVVHLVTTTPMEEAYWVEAFRGISELRDVQFLSPVSVRPDAPRTDVLCAAAGARGASLLLLYVPNRYGPNSAQVLGVLYDVSACRPLAALHASARFLDEEEEEIAPDCKPGDQRAIDAYYQAARAFESHVVGCLGELIHNDLPPTTTQPHRWHTPADERWWVPQGR